MLCVLKFELDFLANPHLQIGATLKHVPMKEEGGRTTISVWFVHLRQKSHHVAQGGLELVIFLPQPPKCCGYMCTLLQLSTASEELLFLLFFPP